MQSDAVYTKAELEMMLIKMKAASNAFYAASTQIGNHAFIEFTGLMNEYINVCRDALAEGRDFTTFNIHSGKSMIKSYQQEYMREKIECIFGVPLEIKIAPEAA